MIFLFIGLFSLLSFLDPMKNYDAGEFVYPEKIGLQLLVGEEQGAIFPFIRLSVVAGGGCDEVEGLMAWKGNYNGNEMQIGITGYRIKKSQTNDDCIAMIQESKKDFKIDLDWLKKNKEIKLIFKRDRGEIKPDILDEYRLYYNEELKTVTLKPITAKKIISYQLGANIGSSAEKLSVVLDERKIYPIKFPAESRVEVIEALKFIEKANVLGAEHQTWELSEDIVELQEPKSFSAGEYKVVFQKDDQKLGLIFQTEEKVGHMQEVVPGKTDVGGFIFLLRDLASEENEGIKLNEVEMEQLLETIYFKFKNNDMISEETEMLNSIKDYVLAIRFSGQGKDKVKDFDRQMRWALAK